MYTHKLKIASLLLLFLSGIANSTFSQNCIPNPGVATFPPGLYPDTIINLSTGMVGTAYSDGLTLVPMDPSPFPPGNFQLIRNALISVTNLPPGLTFSCNTSTNSGSCATEPDLLGCINISGIPTISGTFELILAFEITSFSFSLNVLHTEFKDITGYTITIGNVGNVGIDEAQNDDLISVSPNPASNVVSIDVPISQVNSPYALYSSYGVMLMKGNLESERTTLDIKHLSEGVYLFKMDNGVREVIKRIIKI
jgi:hypothetical protein